MLPTKDYNVKDDRYPSACEGTPEQLCTVDLCVVSSKYGCAAMTTVTWLCKRLSTVMATYCRFAGDPTNHKGGARARANCWLSAWKPFCKQRQYIHQVSLAVQHDNIACMKCAVLSLEEAYVTTPRSTRMLQPAAPCFAMIATASTTICTTWMLCGCLLRRMSTSSG